MPTLFDKVLLTKLHLGMLITLYDDFADNPNLQNPALLEELYKVPYSIDSIDTFHLTEREQDSVELASHLGSQIIELIQDFPQYEQLAKFFQFDLWQFYQCNRYSQLVTSVPSAANCLELATYGPHNMGMVAAGMIDLMATDVVPPSELGSMRTALLLGQRIGRISNMLTTYEREVAEGDVTNELQYSGTLGIEHLDCLFQPTVQERQHELCQERERLFGKMEKFSDLITTFSVPGYIEGLRALQHLHEKMTHTI